MVGQRVLNIRLAQIDAPEIGQPFGARARQSLEELCDAKPVTLDELGFGQDRRVFGEVECDGVDVREEQVRRGMAWVHDEQVEDSRLVALQVEARAQGRGLWSDSSPTPPWEWEPLPSLKITP
jgi:micrococcal nuclease